LRLLWTGTVPTLQKKQENTGIEPTGAALAAALWKPHPEEARSAVSKDEASDPFALMLRDAAAQASLRSLRKLGCAARLLSMRARRAVRMPF
jgi:hypothetical protein